VEDHVKEAWPNHTSLNPPEDIAGIPGANIQHPSLGKSMFSHKLDSPARNDTNHHNEKLETLEEVKNEDAGNGSQEDLIMDQKMEEINVKQLNGGHMNGRIVQEAA